MRVTTPTFSAGRGTYVGADTVSPSFFLRGRRTPKTTLLPTTTPSPPVYTGPVSVAQTTTIGAMAEASGMADSGVSRPNSTHELPSEAAPRFNPSNEPYGAAGLTDLITATSGASKPYTSDGTTPRAACP